MPRSICVYSSSSQKLEQKYYDYAEELGKRIGKNGDTLVFGAGSKGLMGATARGAKYFGAKVIGVIVFVIGKCGAICKCRLTERYHAIGYRKLRKRGATVKCVFTDFCDTAWNIYTRK